MKARPTEDPRPVRSRCPAPAVFARAPGLADHVVAAGWMVLVLAAASGCGGASANTAGASPAIRGMAPAGRAGDGQSEPSERFVLVPEDAWLRNGPDDSAEGARASGRPAGGGDVLVFRAVRAQGDWLAVQTLSPRHGREHCYNRARGLDPYRLTLFVRRDAVRAVTAREVTARYADGTFATLGPGVAIVPAPALSEPGRAVYTVYAAGLMFNTWLDADAVARDYTPGPRFDGNDNGTSPAALLRSVGSLTFGGGARVGTYSRAALPAPVFDRHDEGGASGTRVTVRTPCMQLRARVDPSDIEGAVGGLVGGEAAVDGPGPASVSRGARVYWPDGRSAGRVRRDATLPAEAEPAGGRRCFRAPLLPPRPGHTPGTERSLRVCFDSTDVR